MFRVIEVTTYNDGTQTAQGIYSYEDDITAIATFHSKMGSAMKSAKVQTEMVMVITDKGTVWQDKTEFFDRGFEDTEEQAEE